jgi:hypothetical protein
LTFIGSEKLLVTSVADPDPGSGAFLPLGIRDPGWEKIRIRIGMNNPDHISESLKNDFLG